MQQDAVRKLGFTTDRTMRTAQQLFEGIDVGQGAVGLITYAYRQRNLIAGRTHRNPPLY